MSFLIPLLLPTVADATTKIAIGISNAVQSTTSSVSLQIGSHVFSSFRPFALNDLPYELRERILLMALEGSRELVAPRLDGLEIVPGRPLSQDDYDEIMKHSPMNPSNPRYMSTFERRSANGYPLSSWKWLEICREFWSVLRPVLWENTEIRGVKRYLNFTALTSSPDSIALLKFIHGLTLCEGFTSFSDIYTLLSRFPSLTSFSWSPNAMLIPPFPFGLNLLPPNPGPKSLTLSPPLELITNETTRAHIALFTRLEEFTFTINRPMTSVSTQISTMFSLDARAKLNLKITYAPRLGNRILLEQGYNFAQFIGDLGGGWKSLVVKLPRMEELSGGEATKEAVLGVLMSLVEAQVAALNDTPPQELGGEEVEQLLLLHQAGMKGEVWVERKKVWSSLPQLEEVRLDGVMGALTLSDAAEGNKRGKEQWQREIDMRIGPIGFRMNSSKTG